MLTTKITIAITSTIVFAVLSLNCKTIQHYPSAEKYPFVKNCTSIYDTLLKKEVYTGASTMPKYPGGNVGVSQYSMKNFRHPSDINSDINIYQESFNLEFVIDVDGSLIGERIKGKNMRDISIMEKEMLKILRNMPKWIPGKCDKTVIPIKVHFPINF